MADVYKFSDNQTEFEDIDGLIFAAKKNNREALFIIGLMYYHGNDINALKKIGQHFYKEKTTEKDIGLAFEWFSDAADLGHPQAAYYAGALIQDHNGSDVHASIKEAKKYLKFASKEGNILATERLMHPFLKNKLHEIPASEEGEHTLNLDAFNHLRKPWLWLMLLPSFLLDIVIIFISYQDVIHGYESLSTVLILGIFAFFANAMLFKVSLCHFYCLLRDMRVDSFVMTNTPEVIYVRPPTSFKIVLVKILKVRKNGTIVVNGEIEETEILVNHNDTQQNKKSFHKKEKLIIPGYYVNMQKIIKALKNKCI